MCSYELYRITVVLGPYTASIAFIWSFIFDPISLFYVVGHIENILPTAKFVSMIELPSKGSYVTTYPYPYPKLWYSGLSSLAKPLTN